MLTKEEKVMRQSAQESTFNIKIEFPETPIRSFAAIKPDETTTTSAKALDSSMDTIAYMAKQVTSTVDSMDKARPNEVTVKFGIKFDARAGAIIAKAGIEASMNVELKWQDEKESG